MHASEVNFDGLVGPTHHYGGLSYGNIASMKHGWQVSSPKKAALQGLSKMKFLHDLGIHQGILPPQERPFLPLLRQVGFRGSDVEILQNAWKENPLLVMSCSSASSMWAANAATVTPSSDSHDGKVHFTIANLQNRFHRSLEPKTSFRLFRHIFSDEECFTVHPPLPAGGNFGDEGGANHSRFCKNYGEKGVHLFVYGRRAFQDEEAFSRKFPPRHCLEASQAIARRHGIPKEQLVFTEQHPSAIDMGIFHNDVISFGTQNLFLYHEKAFLNTKNTIQELSEKMERICGCPLETIAISADELSLQKAVQTYFFNSQLVTLPNGKKALLTPLECQGLSIHLPSSLPIYYSDVRQSMENGGGPACLRLRVVLTEEQRKKVVPFFLFSIPLYNQLKEWIEKHFREELSPEDLIDPSFLQETREALDALTKILHMGPFYSFQQGNL